MLLRFVLLFTVLAPALVFAGADKAAVNADAEAACAGFLQPQIISREKALPLESYKPETIRNLSEHQG